MIVITLLAWLGLSLPPAQPLPPPKQPPVLQIGPNREPGGGLLITWEETGNLTDGQLLVIERLRPGRPPLELTRWTHIHTPPAAGTIDYDGRRCDGYRLRLTEGDSLRWATDAPSRCVIGLPLVLSP